MRRSINAPLALALLALAVPPANAQDALGTGNALDRNPNTASGGRNRANRSVFAEVELRNALVTGNVGGGARFRGGLGYTAPRDFRGDTGSGDLFDFVSDSFYSGLATQNLRNIGGVRNAFSRPTLGQIGASSGSFILERPTTTGGDIAGIDPQNPNPGGVSDEQGGGSSAARIDPFNRLNGTLRSTSGYFIRGSESPEILSLRQPQSPNELPQALVASPLQGVKPISVVNASLGYDQITLEPLGSISDTIGAAGDEEVARREGQVDPHRMIVSRLSERIDSIRTLELESELDGRIDDEATDEPRPLGMQTPFNPDDPARMPTTTELLESLRQGFTDNATEFTTMPKDARVPGTRQTDEEEQDPDSPFLTKRIIDNAVKALGGDAIVIDKLVNENRAPSTFKDHMLSGQDALNKGRWFDAEERFTAALQARPDAPLASAGRVNAQVGAGMYRSAALNLRALYRTYPEMLNVRFDAALLPGAERLDAIRDQLRERSRKDTAFARDAGLILAYLGYQFESQADVAEGFGIINRVNEALSVDGDPLDIALERVWAE